MEKSLAPTAGARHPGRLFWAGLAFSLAIVCMVFWPGLAGPFLFDDIGSLGDLGRYGGVDNWHTFREFVFGGITGPTGRPLSLLTFLLDGTNWPTDPWPFKRTNLVIHGVNTLLLGLFVRQALDVLSLDRTRAAAIAVFCALAWGAHPFLVSTVLYPVQRMAQLAALFSFAGLNLYLYGRRRLPTSPRSGYVTMSIALAAGTVLATLSKENGALLPVLIGVLELTLVASQSGRLGSLNRAWVVLFIGLPSAAVLGYLLRVGITTDLFAQQASRGFSPYERLLSESRILVDYLRHWFIPSLITSGIFQDHFEKSTGFLQPVTTLISLLAHAAILTFAWLNRSRRPLFAFAILFFYAGHLVESTVISLELYFEHRNYLPAAFLFLPLAVWFTRRVPARINALAGLATVAILGGFTWYSAGVWSSYPAMVEAAAQVAPTSARAQQQYASLLYDRGLAGEAVVVTERALERQPDDHYLNLWRILLLCRTGSTTPSQFNESLAVLGKQPFDLRSLLGYEQLIAMVGRNECSSVSATQLSQLFDAMLRHPLNADRRRPMFAQLTYLDGQVDLLLEDPQSAMANFSASLESRAGAGRAMSMAALMASFEHFPQALSLSDRALGYFGDDGEQSGMATGATRDDILEFQANVRDAMQPGVAESR